MNRLEINSDWRVKAADALRELTTKIRYEATNPLNPASETFLKLHEELSEHFDISLHDEIVRLVEVEWYARRLLERLDCDPPPAKEDACYTCHSLVAPHDPGCEQYYLEDLLG